MTHYEKHRWMRWLPDPIKREDHQVKGRGAGDDAYALSIHPMTLSVEGQPWLFASNGAASLMMRGHAEWRGPTGPQAEMIRPLVTREISGKLISYSKLKNWIGEGWSRAIPCSSCAGDWGRNCPLCFGIGRKMSSCAECSVAHDCPCRKCDGTGLLYCPSCVGSPTGFKTHPGHYKNVVFDRGMLSRFLAYAEVQPGTMVRIEAEGKERPIWIEHEHHEWRVAIAPLREPDAHLVSGFVA